MAQYVWWPTLSPDEVERRYINDVDVKGDWEALGIVPEELENMAIAYVRRFRNAYVAESRSHCVVCSLMKPTLSTNYARPVKLPNKDSGSSSVRHSPIDGLST